MDDPNFPNSSTSNIKTRVRILSDDAVLPATPKLSKTVRDYASCDELETKVEKSAQIRAKTSIGVLSNLFKKDGPKASYDSSPLISHIAVPQDESLNPKVKGQMKGHRIFSGLRLMQELDGGFDSVATPVAGLSSQGPPNSHVLEKSATEVVSPKASPNLRRSNTARQISGLKANTVWIMRFNHDGSYMACGKNNGEVGVWKVMKPIRTILFESVPFLTFNDHALPVTDVTWSNGNFLLTSSMDNTVRLYHINQKTCLCTFHHSDSVSSVRFHPIDQQFFITASIDGRIRVWSIPLKKILYWNEIYRVPITSIAFTRDGSTVIAGTSTGLCIFYDFEGLKYNTQIHMSGKGKFKECKITGIEQIPRTQFGDYVSDKLLISSTDSRIRLINVRDKSLYRKYKGIELKSGRLFASFSHDGRYIISGSEDRQVFIWDTTPENISQQFSGLLSHVMHWQSDAPKSVVQERFVASTDPISFALFAPCVKGNPDAQITNSTHSISAGNEAEGMMIIVADLSGRIKIYENDSTAPKSGVESLRHEQPLISLALSHSESFE